MSLKSKLRDYESSRDIMLVLTHRNHQITNNEACRRKKFLKKIRTFCNLKSCYVLSPCENHKIRILKILDSIY